MSYNAVTLNTLLWYYYQMRDHPDLHTGKSTKEGCDRLVADGLMERQSTAPPPGEFEVPSYKLTPMGHAFVQMLRNTPLPVHIWADPRE